ncbi:MarR family winged helix-turn-helix transcriptional regulator [uncultured Clostridium sp.]|jgi:DNA-binding MarR family transcriptional regulator|uniref:MarR family winged helix-turn-helix transcriptional regulator n=1 Tax=Clostridium sp. TaxID=1506 RepID=UPI0025F36F34|nr:MarR family winged helix-turn-helix transcriptional regulator [uncultured Clostridium sp.]
MIRKESEDVLNMLLVKLFNDILKIEAAAIKQGEFSDLSVTENHIIEAIGKDREMTMTEVAKDLDITVGTLTTAINRLIKKEYVERRRIEEDRRVVLIKLTNKGEMAFDSHAQFHDDMIKSIIQELPETEETVLITSLKRMTNFFEEKYNLLG